MQATATGTSTRSTRASITGRAGWTCRPAHAPSDSAARAKMDRARITAHPVVPLWLSWSGKPRSRNWWA